MTGKKQKTPGKKSVRKSVRPGQLVPARNGGAIRHGSQPGNTPGTGRPPDALKAKLRELGLKKAAPLLSKILDGKITVSLLGKCDACNHEQPISDEWVEHIMQRITASMDHQLKASEQTLKYGKADRELVIASQTAATFFDCVHAAIVELGGDQLAESVKVRAMALMEAAK